LSASADFVYCVEGRLAEPAEVERQAARAEGDALDGGAHERLGALHLVAVTILRADEVEPRRRALAGIGLTVPAEPRDAGLARAEVDLPDELPVRAADLHLHGVGADGEPHGRLDPVLAEVPLPGADPHVAADQPGRLERLVGDERLGQRRERPLEARDAGHRAELRELPEELAALEGPERILVLELRDHELEELLLTEAAIVVLGPKLGARA